MTFAEEHPNFHIIEMGFIFRRGDLADIGAGLRGFRSRNVDAHLRHFDHRHRLHRKRFPTAGNERQEQQKRYETKCLHQYITI